MSADFGSPFSFWSQDTSLAGSRSTLLGLTSSSGAPEADDGLQSFGPRKTMHTNVAVLEAPHRFKLAPFKRLTNTDVDISEEFNAYNTPRNFTMSMQDFRFPLASPTTYTPPNSKKGQSSAAGTAWFNAEKGIELCHSETTPPRPTRNTGASAGLLVR